MKHSIKQVVVHNHKDFSMGVGVDKPTIMFDSSTDSSGLTVQQYDCHERPRLSSIIVSQVDGEIIIEFDVYDE